MRALVSVAQSCGEAPQADDCQCIVLAVGSVAEGALHEACNLGVTAAVPTAPQVSGDGSRGRLVELAVDERRHGSLDPTVRERVGHKQETHRQGVRLPGE